MLNLRSAAITSATLAKVLEYFCQRSAQKFAELSENTHVIVIKTVVWTTEPQQVEYITYLKYP